MANNLHIKNLLLWKQEVYAKETDIYAAWRTKESGMTTCQVERWSVKGSKDAGIGRWWSAAMNWVAVEEASEGVQESLWVVAPIIVVIIIIIIIVIIIIIIIGFVHHRFNFNQFANMLYVPCTFSI